MRIEVKASGSVKRKDSLGRFVADHISGSFGRFKDEITSVEVRFSDESHEGGMSSGARCALDAKLRLRNQVVVSHSGEDLDLAFRGACSKLGRALEREIGRQGQKTHRHRETARRSTFSEA